MDNSTGGIIFNIMLSVYLLRTSAMYVNIYMTRSMISTPVFTKTCVPYTNDQYEFVFTIFVVQTHFLISISNVFSHFSP